MAYSGKFKPSNPSKYDGDPTTIIYRSLLERRFMVYLDTNTTILKWSSEQVIIPYISPLDNRLHRYFPDFHVVSLKDGEKQTLLIEVKPKSQSGPPKPLTGETTLKKKRRYLKEVRTWGVNEAKWNAAIEWCKLNNAKFVVMNENEVNALTCKAAYKHKRDK